MLSVYSDILISYATSLVTAVRVDETDIRTPNGPELT
jgi:hypothetical protein